MLKKANQFRHKLAYILLTRRVKNIHRNKSVVNYRMAKNILLLFDATMQTELDDIMPFLETLKVDSKVIDVLGFVDKKGLSDFHSYDEKITYICRTDFDFFLRSKNRIVNKLTRIEYDVLINLDRKSHYPLDYVTGLSLAKYKIGKYNKSKEIFYDLMIKDEEGSLLEYIKTIEYYLKTINTIN